MLSTAGYLSTLSTGLAGLRKHISLTLADILYNMDTFNVDDSNLRVIDNVGGTGYASDAPMYASNHIFLDGSTQSVDYVTVSGSDYVYFDTATKAHVSGTAVGATSNITASHSNFTSLKDGASVVTADKTYLDAHPESIARLVDGETVSGLSFDLTDIEAFYPGNEGNNLTIGQYVHDVKADLGTELVTGDDSTFDTVGNWQADDGTLAVASNILTLTYTAATQRSRLPISGLTIGKTYIVTGYVKSPTAASAISAGFASATYGSSIALSTEWQPVSNIVTATATTHDFGFFTVLSTGETYDIKAGVSVREITSFTEIINYASTCRTNLDLTNYGASNLLYKQDATGRFTGMADANLIEFTGDGRYADTGWVPSASDDWTMGVVYNLSGGISEYFGIDIAKFRIGESAVNTVRVTLNGTSYSLDIGSSGLVHVLVTSGGDIYVNGVYKITVSMIAFSVVSSFFFGSLANQVGVNAFKSTTGLFKVHKNKALTADEVATAYAQAKITYPSLP